MLSNNEILISAVINCKGNWNETYKIVSNHKYYPETKMDCMDNFITILDKEYPEQLKQAYKPPFVLFYKGDIALLKEHNLISLGAGRKDNVKVEHIDLLLDKSYTYIISESILGCIMLEKGYKVILVLNTPMVDSEFTRKTVKNGGLVITELPYNADTITTDFTRIMSALESKLVVMTCSNKSWALRQITYSNYLGHDIYVVPTDVSNTELRNNEFINEGAYLLYNKKQLAVG